MTVESRRRPARPRSRAAAATAPSTAQEAAFVADQVADAVRESAIERDHAPAGTVPYAALEVLDRSGLLGITVPTAHDGPELPPSVLADVVRRIAAADPAIAQVPQGHYLSVDVLRAAGTDAARQRLFAAVLRGERIGNALAERGGHHAQDLRTRIGRHDDGTVRIDGRKYYCTGAISSRWITVTALDPDEHLVAAVVARDAPGLAFDTDWDVVGQRATVSGSTVLDAVPVDPTLVLDYGRLFDGPQQIGARAQLVHTAIQVGIARGALDDARRFLQDRARPSSESVRAGHLAAVDDPATLQRYGRAEVRVQAAEALLREAGRTLDDVGLVPDDRTAATRGSLAVASAKAFASEVAVETASELFVLGGASAADQRLGLDRHWRNARVHSVHDPVDWKYHHIAAHALTGADPPNHGQL